MSACRVTRRLSRPSTPTEPRLEPGRYWVWARNPATGRTSERALVRVAGQNDSASISPFHEPGPAVRRRGRPPVSLRVVAAVARPFVERRASGAIGVRRAGGRRVRGSPSRQEACGSSVWLASRFSRPRLAWPCCCSISTRPPACVAGYDGRPVVIGREYPRRTWSLCQGQPALVRLGPLARRRRRPARLDAGFDPIVPLLVSWGGLLAVPFFAACVGALISAAPVPPGAAPAPVRRVARVPASAPVYDAFLSYRHTEPDTAHADELLEALESPRPARGDRFSRLRAQRAFPVGDGAVHQGEPLRAVRGHAAVRGQRPLLGRGDHLQDAGHGRAPEAARAAHLRAGRAPGVAARPGRHRLHRDGQASIRSSVSLPCSGHSRRPFHVARTSRQRKTPFEPHVLLWQHQRSVPVAATASGVECDLWPVSVVGWCARQQSRRSGLDRGPAGGERNHCCRAAPVRTTSPRRRSNAGARSASRDGTPRRRRHRCRARLDRLCVRAGDRSITRSLPELDLADPRPLRASRCR